MWWLDSFRIGMLGGCVLILCAGFLLPEERDEYEDVLSEPDRFRMGTLGS